MNRESCAPVLRYEKCTIINLYPYILEGEGPHGKS